MPEVKATKEDVKGGTRDGTRQEVTKEAKAEVKRASHLSPIAIAHAINAAGKGISPRTALEVRMR